MKIKEIDRTANVAWSPAKLDNIYLAAGTAAQQLDSSFSTNAVLEVYQLNINEPGLDVPVKATYTSENRFHKVVWGHHGVGGDKNEYPAGIIVGGCDGGVMQVYNAYKLFQNEDPVVFTKTKHTGPVRALDFNCFRSNLIASGATESEIFIWDMNNPKVPMSPGAKIQPADDITDLEWNKQVEHILATTFPSRCVVWDLRKNEPVIKVSDTASRIRYKCVRWHPEVATQMCLASEDDTSPVIQLWDLRYATSPLKVIQGHQRGILGMSWCAQDTDLLLSCGKDSKILCWNPNYVHAGYEMVLDIPTSSQWSFDISFCPKNPVVISSCTYDGRISIYGLSGGAQQPVTSSKLADSFPGMDMSISHTPMPAQPVASQQLRDPPKWLKRPSGASFAFGGKLVSFQNIKTPSTQPGQSDKVSGVLTISQIVTLPSFIERSKKLEDALATGSLEYYCAEKAGGASDKKEANVWEFLQASFSQNPRQAYISLLGFNTSEIVTKLQENLNTGDLERLTDDFNHLGQNNETVSGEPENKAYQNGIGDVDLLESISEFPVPTDDSVDGKINQALLCGSIDVAVYLCLENERWADALLLASKGSPELMTKVQTKYFQKCHGKSADMIRAVVKNDIKHLVSNCELESWKQVLATALTYADDAEFQSAADTLGKRLLESKKDNLVHGALLCFICSGSLNQLVDAWVGSSGKDSTSPDELQDLVEQVMILKKAAEMWGRDSNIGGGSLAGKMVEYASILASQGCLDTALTYLKDSNDPSILNLKERLQLSLGYTRQQRSQFARSRQSSESSTSGLRSIHKRPSHPAAPVKRGSELYQTNDFSNLTGPAHPPAASLYNPPTHNSNYGVQNQFSAPPPPSGPAMSYGQQNNQPSGLPPIPTPTAAAPGSHPTLYNPVEAAAELATAKAQEHIQRKISGGSLPRPPVSNVASGWNDPPPILVKSKSTQPATPSQQPITHPIFGSAPEPAAPAMPSGLPSGMGMPPPQPYGSSMPPPPTAASRPYGAPTPVSTMQSYNSTSVPPPMTSGRAYGATPPPTFTPGPPTAISQSYGTGNAIPSAPVPNQAFGGHGSVMPPPPTAASQPYGGNSVLPPPPSMTSQYGNMSNPPPPSSQSFGGASIPPPPTASTQPYGSGVPSMGTQSSAIFNPMPSGNSSMGSQPYGMPPPPSNSGSNFFNPSQSMGAQQSNPLPPPPTAAMQPYMSASATGLH